MIMFVAAAAAVAVPAAAKSDLECLAIYAAATGMAKTDQEKMPIMLGTAYFFGRVDAVAPNIDLAAMIQETGKSLDALGQPKLQAVGAACDKKFQAMGARFTAAGDALKKQ